MATRSTLVASLASPVTDTVLVQQLWQGDLNALGLLYDRYAGLVYTIALRSLGDVASAEDLTQDVFLTLMNSRTYDPERGSLSSYLSLLTRSRAIDRLRAQSTQHRYLHQWHQQPRPSEPSPIEHASQVERQVIVREALAQLNEQQRQILAMSYYEGRSQAEISRQLGVPLGTVKSWARRGLLQLRSQLQAKLSEGKS